MRKSLSYPLSINASVLTSRIRPSHTMLPTIVMITFVGVPCRVTTGVKLTIKWLRAKFMQHQDSFGTPTFMCMCHKLETNLRYQQVCSDSSPLLLQTALLQESAATSCWQPYVSIAAAEVGNDQDNYTDHQDAGSPPFFCRSCPKMNTVVNKKRGDSGSNELWLKELLVRRL